MMLAKVFVALATVGSAIAQSTTASAVAGGAPDPAINTPSGVQECLPIQLTFSGSSPPFVITVQPGGQAGAAPLVTVGTTSANAITWNANLPEGTSCTLVIRDSLGRTSPSAPFTILPGTTDCLTGSASESIPATTAAVGGSTPVTDTTTSQAAGSSPAASNTLTGSPSSSRASASTSPSATTSKNGASALHPAGLVGLVAAAGLAALL